MYETEYTKYAKLNIFGIQNNKFGTKLAEYTWHIKPTLTISSNIHRGEVFYFG